jgi:peroxiredoxin
MSELLAVGSRAPAFEGAASDGNAYRLADVLQTKHVALIFYPGNNTPG